MSFVRKVVVTTAIAGAAVLLAVVVWRARLALLVIYLSLLFAAGIGRPVGALERWDLGRGRHLPRWLAALLVYVVGLAIVAFALALVVNPLMGQTEELWREVPRQFDRLQDALRHYGLVSRHVTLQEAVQDVPHGDALASMNTVLTAGFTFAGIVAAIVSIIILSYYVVVQGQAAADYLFRFVPEHRRGSIQQAVHGVVLKVSRWLEGTVIVGGIMGGVTALSLGLLGVPFFYVVAVLSALGEAIPMVGPILAGTAAVAVSLTVSVKLAVGVGVLFTVLHEIEANVLVPKIMEERVGVGAIAIMCGLLIGWELMGVLGAVIAIPTVAILAVVTEQGVLRSPALRLPAMADRTGAGTGL
jgi:predicted PurR-regulated permease PerM